MYVVNFGMRDISEITAFFAAKFGTRLLNLLWGSDFAYVSYNGGGENTMRICSVRCYFSFIEILSVLKLVKKSFWLLWMLIM